MKKLRDIAGYVLGGVLFVALLPTIMWLQVLTEEKRLRNDFGEEYDEYCKRTRRF